MGRRILLITKPPEFDSKGEVVLGQCEPFTSGWELRLVTDGESETLATGTYTDLRKIQEACIPLSSPVEVRRKAEEMKPLLLLGGSETLVMKAETGTAPDGEEEEAAPRGGNGADAAPEARGESEREPEEGGEEEEAEAAAGAGGEEGAGGEAGDGAVSGGESRKASEETDRILVTVEALGKGVIASIQDPSVAADVGMLNNMLNTLLQQGPRAIVLDLGRIETLSSRAAREMGRFRDECRAKGCRFVLGAVRQSVRKVLDLIELPEPVEAYESLDGAVEAVEKHSRGAGSVV
ncbi:MAG: STAS domain-containing protein [Planctomycetota bacterium]|nr:STAS domain-containing protein [Planctomycetota bacterium]